MAGGFNDIRLTGIGDDVAIVIGADTGVVGKLALAILADETGHQFNGFGGGAGAFQAQAQDFHADQFGRVGLR